MKIKMDEFGYETDFEAIKAIAFCFKNIISEEGVDTLAELVKMKAKDLGVPESWILSQIGIELQLAVQSEDLNTFALKNILKNAEAEKNT